MPHTCSSCRVRALTALKRELLRLYAQRSAVDAAIRDLELRRKFHGLTSEPTGTESLEFPAKLCNLTSCGTTLPASLARSTPGVDCRYASRARTDRESSCGRSCGFQPGSTRV